MNLVQRHASWSSTNPRITIIEGDIALAVALSHNLKTEGYVVESLDRGDEAVRKLTAKPPDLVILDWMSSGVNAGARLHRLPEQRCINDAGENAVEHRLISWASGWGQIVFGRVGVVAA